MSALGRKRTFCQDQLLSASNVRFRPKADAMLLLLLGETNDLRLPVVGIGGITTIRKAS